MQEDYEERFFSEIALKMQMFTEEQLKEFQGEADAWNLSLRKFLHQNSYLNWKNQIDVVNYQRENKLIMCQNCELLLDAKTLEINQTLECPECGFIMIVPEINEVLSYDIPEK